MSTQKRLCDYCSEATALLFCRADSAKLCFHCDREVHSTNQLFSKHTRFQLCDGCDASSASIFCSTENSLLCHNCDWENHGHALSSVHDRRPLEGFTGYPSVAELSAIIGIEDSFQKTLSLSDGPDGCRCCDGDDGFKRSVGLADEFSDMLFWDTPAVVSIDDLITPTYSSLSFQAMEVPPLPKNLNASCGHHKEEILAQLRGLAQLEPNFKFSHANLQGFQPVQLEQNLQRVNEFMGFGHVDEPTVFHTYEASSFQWNDERGEAANQGFLPNTTLSGYLEESFKVPEVDVSSSLNHANSGHEVQSQCPVPVNSETIVVPAKLALDELNSQDRETAISRYKEKKRTRRYDKHIRYESRKVRAESRIRIRGRFAKKDC